MDGRQLVDMLDILRNEAEKSGSDFDALYQVLAQGIQEGTTRILRHGNTLLIYDILSPGVAEIHMATMDEPRDIVEALKSFYHAFKVAGFKKLILEDEDPNVMRYLDMAKIAHEDSTNESGYEITIEVTS